MIFIEFSVRCVRHSSPMAHPRIANERWPECREEPDGYNSIVSHVVVIAEVRCTCATVRGTGVATHRRHRRTVMAGAARAGLTVAGHEARTHGRRRQASARLRGASASMARTTSLPHGSGVVDAQEGIARVTDVNAAQEARELYAPTDPSACRKHLFERCPHGNVVRLRRGTSCFDDSALPPFLPAPFATPVSNQVRDFRPTTSQPSGNGNNPLPVLCFACQANELMISNSQSGACVGV